MTIIVLRILAALNALVGIAMVVGAVWPSSDPGVEKKPFLVVVYLIWGVLFLGLALETFNLKPAVRKWTISLYGVASFIVIWDFIWDVITHDRILQAFPLVNIFTHVLFLAFFIWPVIFMLRPSMKEYFENVQESRRRAEDEAARSSLRR